MIIKSPKDQYDVGELVRETSTYRLYLCDRIDPPTGASEDTTPEGWPRSFLLQVAKEVENNGSLDFNAHLLDKLARNAATIEAEYEEKKTKEHKRLNYQLGFPGIADSFKLAEQGNRRVNVLEFRNVSDVTTLIPLARLLGKNKLRVDIRTSIWILGKLLKLIAFAHDFGIKVGDVSVGNILIDPKQHFVIILDWAQAQIVNDEKVPGPIAREEVQQAAETTIKILGGSLETGIPDDGSAEYLRYVTHVMNLQRDGNFSAFKAHNEFYKLVDSMWPRGFHEFTTMPLLEAVAIGR